MSVQEFLDRFSAGLAVDIDCSLEFAQICEILAVNGWVVSRGVASGTRGIVAYALSRLGEYKCIEKSQYGDRWVTAGPFRENHMTAEEILCSAADELDELLKMQL